LSSFIIGGLIAMGGFIVGIWATLRIISSSERKNSLWSSDEKWP
jgi:hypothetical protein